MSGFKGHVRIFYQADWENKSKLHVVHALNKKISYKVGNYYSRNASISFTYSSTNVFINSIIISRTAK